MTTVELELLTSKIDELTTLAAKIKRLEKRIETIPLLAIGSIGIHLSSYDLIGHIDDFECEEIRPFALEYTQRKLEELQQRFAAIKITISKENQ